MSSPLRRRSALTSKNVNLNSRSNNFLTKSMSSSSLPSNSLSRSPSGSPTRCSQKTNIRQSPLKKRISGTPSPIKRLQQGFAFSFHEDNSPTRISIIKSHEHINPRENDDGTAKENVSPIRTNTTSKKNNESAKLHSIEEFSRNKTEKTSRRIPLQELRASDYPGYLEDPITHNVCPLDVPFSVNHNSSSESSKRSSPSRILRF
ncbi:similar to Saccharomyces cerevisiae YPL267W ACM1 Pseudosubstrate inhibitor of the anaphase-promoting complex/cyclosome (APC/C) [Maudiozyma barnettii]|uniref:Similar to Saccharomyces cerevisiae YPL267W ACM1 Pseudosubstrate inhibitor of the anaphase-promoting complex/cyclosome (APC/C) n=1 Tax=Maudiozyma barnettii TaxID=61262 RepID=A0A8H2ZJ28_9SACH|nr:Acm1p [Kazachstania barnettii]CAB4255573.1 similar to Saccharomyces cerevisiae YPL267W ACM1 Pseudosubstrate inhibitor of the anaphase-promoting complex/cyclosome (APC/C) [Kazachstania barnettii]CAD1784071.1 similar to Saccharomyces cerevisiae YPL267W ACM1 Pseudosubstrate inhibitor of the anaphase-promoting complex/cyclosome (APC/C) [Kazachstania barnettii]